MTKAEAAEMVKAKEFTMVMTHTSDPFATHRFVALTPSLPVARLLASEYVKAKGWNLGDNRVYYYPRTYVRKCLALVADGKYISGRANTAIEVEIGE